MEMGRSKTTFGKDNPPKGRPKGSENKRTKEQREAYEEIMEILENRLRNSKDDFDKLPVGRVADIFTALLNYKKPKLNSNTNANTHSGGLNIVVTHQELPPLPDNDSDNDNGE